MTLSDFYFVLFFFMVGYFVIKTILSFVLGDLDIDIDADGDVDFDVSSLLSLKGFLHFILGFTGTMTYASNFQYGIDYHYPFWIYPVAIIDGILCMVILWYIYKAIYRLGQETNETPDFDGCKCTVSVTRGDGKYTVLIHTAAGTFERDVTSEDLNIKAGEQKKIKIINNNLTI